MGGRAQGESTGNVTWGMITRALPPRAGGAGRARGAGADCAAGTAMGALAAGAPPRMSSTSATARATTLMASSEMTRVVMR